MKTSKALKYLRKIEWGMGNGQCEECEGCSPYQEWWTETVGHMKNCKLAQAIESLGGKVVWEKKNRSKTRKDFAKFNEHVLTLLLKI